MQTTANERAAEPSGASAASLHSNKQTVLAFYELARIFAEEEFVIAHVHGIRVPGQRGSARASCDHGQAA